MKHDERDISTLKHIVIYGQFDVLTLWETVTEDIEPLREYCLKCIEELGG